MDSLNEHRACTNLHVTIRITEMNAEMCLTIKERKQQYFFPDLNK